MAAILQQTNKCFDFGKKLVNPLIGFVGRYRRNLFQLERRLGILDLRTNRPNISRNIVKCTPNIGVAWFLVRLLYTLTSLLYRPSKGFVKVEYIRMKYVAYSVIIIGIVAHH